jgi:hypothetical protein
MSVSIDVHSARAPKQEGVLVNCYQFSYIKQSFGVLSCILLLERFEQAQQGQHTLSRLSAIFGAAAIFISAIASCKHKT